MTRAALLLALAGFVWGCPSHTQLAPAERAGVEAALSTHPDKFLRISFHLTPFFGDASRHLLTEVPPELVRLVHNPDGTPLSPGPVLETLPAGTPVRVLGVEFPTAWHVSRRLPYTPRDRAWVEVAIEGQRVPAVLVLPRHFRTSAELLGELERYLSDHDPSRQLSQLNPRVQDAVRTKTVVLDMTASALEMAWGYPDEKKISYEQGTRREEWIYADRRRVAHLLEGRLARWEPE